MNKKDKQDKLNAIFVDLDLLNKEPCIHSEKNIEEIRIVLDLLSMNTKCLIS